MPLFNKLIYLYIYNSKDISYTCSESNRNHFELQKVYSNSTFNDVYYFLLILVL